MVKKYLGILFIILLLSSCVSGPKLIKSDMPFQKECLEILIDDNHGIPSIDYKNRDKPEWAWDLDERIYNMAIATNVVDDLEKLISYQDEDKNSEYDKTLQQVLQRVNLTSLEVSAIAGGLDCEEEKAEQLANYINRIQRKHERNLTVASIITGASASIIMGAILFAGGSDTKIELVGIAGGLTEVYLGLKILRLEKQTEIRHHNNVLRMIADGDNSKGVFPSSVWYYLHSTISEEEETLRDRLLNRWERYRDLPEDELDILFGDGGKYNVNMLNTRADLLDQLGAQITLMKQDLLKFNRFLLNL